jgi:flagellar biosynthesis/type III secretory pathway chaperone
MYRPVIEMEKILSREIELYESIYKLEIDKSEAIIQKEWEIVENLSARQETGLSEIDSLEKSREVLIEDYRKINNLDDLSRKITLKEIVLSMDEDSSHHLLQMGMELKDIMNNTSKLVKTNDTLLHDNMEFFNILMSGLKNNRGQAGYGNDGKEENLKASDPLLFNQTA